MAFIGCRGRGMRNVRPVRMLVRPVKTSVVEREMEFVRVKAMRSGSSVPRSPREPETSESRSEGVERECRLRDWEGRWWNGLREERRIVRARCVMIRYEVFDKDGIRGLHMRL